MRAGQMRGYLAGTAALISQFDAFEVLAHIDCPLQPAGRFTELVRWVRRATMGVDRMRFSGTSWDMIHNLHRADQADLGVTDVTRTAAGPDAGCKEVFAGQSVCWWVGIGSL